MRPPLALTVIPVRSQWSCYNFARWYKPPKVSKKSHPKVDSMPRLDEDSSDAKQWDAPLEVPAMALSKIGWVDTPASWQFHGKMIIMLVQKKGPPSSIEKSWVGLKPSIYMDSLWHCFTNCRFFNYPNLRPIMYDQKHQQLLQKWQPPYYFSNYIMACSDKPLLWFGTEGGFKPFDCVETRQLETVIMDSVGVLHLFSAIMKLIIRPPSSHSVMSLWQHVRTNKNTAFCCCMLIFKS